MPRAGLDRAQVVTAAARIADAHGLEALSFARLAQDLNIRPPSLYNHVRSLDDLREALCALALRDLLDASLNAAAGRSGQDALRAVARAHRAYGTAHPGLYTAANLHVAQQGPEAHATGAQLVNVILAVLNGYGLEGDTALHATRVLRAALHGFITLELGGGFGLPLEVDRSFDLLLDTLHVGLQGANRAP